MTSTECTGKRMWQRHMSARLEECGWCFIPKTLGVSLEQVATALGTVSRGVEQRNVIVARTQEEGSPRSFSGMVGYGAQPFHTDAAHWPTPPRYVVLHHVSGTGATRTMIGTIQSPSLIGALRESSWLVSGGERKFLSSGIACLAKATMLRFDPICMAPLNAAAIDARRQLMAGVKLEVEAVPWSPHATLVIDNWRALHARGAITAGEADRVLVRIYVEKSDEI